MTTTDKTYKDNGYVITDIDLFNRENSCTKELSHINKIEDHFDNFDWNDYKDGFDNLPDFYTKVFNDKYGKNWLKKFVDQM